MIEIRGAMRPDPGILHLPEKRESRDMTATQETIRSQIFIVPIISELIKRTAETGRL
jgi:hypothetical protein